MRRAPKRQTMHHNANSKQIVVRNLVRTRLVLVIGGAM